MTDQADMEARGGLPSIETMDVVARRLGAPDHRAFLATAPYSMKCAFKLACEYHDAAAEREAAAYARAAEVAQSEADDIHQHAHLKTDPWQMGRAAMASTIATAILSLKEAKG